MTAPFAPSIQIRPMTQEDIPFVAALEAEIFSDAWSETLYRETLESGRYDCQVMELVAPEACAGENDLRETSQEGCLAGYFCGQVILDEAEVHRIAVQPSLRGRGCGQQLLVDFLERVRNCDVISVLLEVRAGNAPAIGLYEKNGFTTIGVRKGYYQKPKEDALIMQCCF